MKLYESKKASSVYVKEMQPQEYTAARNSFEVTINPNERYQEWLGFGGSFTESAAYVFSLMPEDEQEAFIQNYFNPKTGNGYSFCRLTIHSCDFSMSNYEYTRDWRDKELKSFSIANDLVYIIPMIKRAQAAAGRPITFFASPWSPPSFMKTNNQMSHGGKLRPEFAQMWADYFVKYIKAYANEGIEIWGVTVQNEPAASQTWESCLYSAEEERDFVKNYLAPTFKKHGLTTKIIMHDHNRDIVFDRMDIAYSDAALRELVWGTGIHWYMAEDYENVVKLKEKYPEKHIVFTEGCCPYSTAEGGFTSGSWANGEKYAKEIICNANSHVESFTDWNMLLDGNGGPNHVNNFCDAPVMYHEKQKRVVYQNSFYYIRHFAQFIKPSMRRAAVNIPHINGLYATAFTDGETNVLVVLNMNDAALTYTILDNGQPHNIKMPGHGIQTMVFN
jgi:glucosylceramidase